jgi:hypothetical protein
MDGERAALVRELETSGLMKELVATRRVEEGSTEQRELAAASPGWTHIVEHERIPVLSYPYEWSFGMLAEAALLTLRLQGKLLDCGYSLKDASAFNIQFVGPRPVFIDILSVEKIRRADVWPAYGQFCRMFLNPLLAAAHRGLTFRQVFLGSLEGIDNASMIKLFGASGCIRHGMVLDVLLPGMLERGVGRDTRGVRDSLEKQGGDVGVQQMNLRRLERRIEKLVKRSATSNWSSYEKTCTYDDKASAAKMKWVGDFLAASKPATVLDLGCNRGAYSAIAAASGARVVSVDADEVCVDHVHAMAREKQLDILPMVADLANPSPAVGFLHRERQGFHDRVSAECVLALALVHHLLVAARLPLASLPGLFAGLTARDLVVEFVEREDEMFQTLLALREDHYRDLTLEKFIAAFEKDFELRDRSALPGTRRHLLAFRKKS